MSAIGQNCDDTCSFAEVGATCSVEGQRRVYDIFQMDYVIYSVINDGDVYCDTWESTTVGAEMNPKILTSQYTLRRCYYDGSLSTCGDTDALFRRVCCCISPTTTATTPWVDECFVPTTTSTSTSVTITQTTATETSTTTTSQTITTSTVSSTQTSSVTTVTATTTTATSTSSSTQTATSTTTTLASTNISVPLSPGDDTIYVDDANAFRPDDLLYIGEFEIVTVLYVNNTRRLLEEDDPYYDHARRLGPGSITVTPPIVNSYPSGTSIRNLGQASVYYAGSDPITFYGGKKFKFWLPPDTEILMLETPDVKLYGSVFAGPEPDQQWFDSFRVVLPDGSNVAKIGVKRDGNLTASMKCSHKQFESLNVELGKSFQPLHSMEALYLSASETVKLEVNCRLQEPPLLWNTRTEYMYFETSEICFAITASHAGNEFPDNMTKAVEFSHLDFVIMEMKGHTKFSGILPEIWEVKPRSEAVQVMLSPEGQYLDLSDSHLKPGSSTVTI